MQRDTLIGNCATTKKKKEKKKKASDQARGSTTKYKAHAVGVMKSLYLGLLPQFCKGTSADTDQLTMIW